MRDYQIISADTHIVEPPDLYSSRIDPRYRDRAPRIERRDSPDGAYDAWFVDNAQVGALAPLIQVGRRFEDTEHLDFVGTWEDVRKGGYDPHEMIKDLEIDGVWGACLQPTQGLLWYRIPDSEFLSAINRAYNNWITDFCAPHPERLKGIGCIDVDNVEDGCKELERCAKLGLVAVFIPVYPMPDKPYRDPRYERLWATAQDLDMPLLLHVATNRDGVPGCENTSNVSDMTQAGLATLAHWCQYSLTTMIFAGIFDRYPRLRVGSVEHEMGWIPHWLKMMDFNYVNRPKFDTGWRSEQGFLPSDYWQHNMFVEFMEDDIGIKLRDIIGVDQMMWGNDYPHHESTWPISMDFLDKIFVDVDEDDKRKTISSNAAQLFKFNI